MRDTGFLGGGLSARIYLNKEPIADVDAGETLSIWLEPGIYILGMLQKPNLFGYEVPREIEVEIKSGRRFNVRVGFSEEGPVFLPLTY